MLRIPFAGREIYAHLARIGAED